MAVPRPSGPQLWRLQQILEWLRTGRRLTQTLAAEAFEVSSRTIASDLEYLRQIGVPLTFDRRKRSYVLTEPFGNLPILSLTRTEFAAFLVARHALDALGDTAHADLLERVMERLSDHLPETIRVEPETLSRTIRFERGPGPATPLPYLEALSEAIASQRVVRMRYYSNSRGQETERDVEPYHLLSYQGRGYLIAYCRLRRAMRDFRIDRIRAFELRNEVFVRDETFDLDAYLGPAFGMHRGERRYAVHIRFSPYQARWIREERWHESQMMFMRPDGSLDLHMEVTGLTDVTRWVLSYGGEAEVISPPVLRHRVAREARRMAALYAGVGAVDASGHP
ncbi:MAG: DNA-binding protein [Rhodothermaceae bacterium]|nr:MAG: DNA-binding protein [Rhodothermaceae bacterium]